MNISYRKYYGDDNVVFLENIDINDIREISLSGDFRLACGESQQLLAVIFPADGEPIAWASSDPSVLTVENGLVTAVGPGTAAVTASVGNISTSVTVNTYVAATGFELSAEELWELATNNVKLSIVSYEPENAVADISWSVSDESIGRVDQNGLVTTVMYGDLIVTATSERGVTRSCMIHLFRPVTAVSLTAPQDVLLTGRDMQLTAHVTAGNQSCENHLVTFTSSDESVATVDRETGLVHPVAPGTVTFTAASANNKFGTVTIQVEFDLEGLQILRLPEDLLEIGEEAFSGLACEAVIIPDHCTAIGNRAFANCENLVYVYIPASVAYIPEDAFSGCPRVFIFHAGE